MLAVWSYLNSCASQYLSKLITKFFTVLAVITSLGRLFQMSTILFVKENFRMLSLLYFFFSFLSFPLVHVFSSRSSKPSVTSLLMILKVSIMSPVDACTLGLAFSAFKVYLCILGFSVKEFVLWLFFGHILVHLCPLPLMVTILLLHIRGVVLLMPGKGIWNSAHLGMNKFFLWGP